MHGNVKDKKNRLQGGNVASVTRHFDVQAHPRPRPVAISLDGDALFWAVSSCSRAPQARKC